MKRSSTDSLNSNHVLKQGQLGIEMPKPVNTSGSKFRMKIGDGTSKWSTLPYFGETDLSGYVPTSRKINGQSLTRDLILRLDDINYNNAGAHNCNYRGENLGTSLTTYQRNNIASGSFYNMYIGDYWEINGRIYRIAAFDYFLNTGDGAYKCTTHHVIIVPDEPLYTAKMNVTDTTEGGYVGSDMYTTNLAEAKTTIHNDFNGHLLGHRMYFINAVTNGKPSAGTWYDSQVDLMSERMVFGNSIQGAVDGATTTCIDGSQFPLFFFRHDFVVDGKNSWWLRDISNASRFAVIYNHGAIASAGAAAIHGVRPFFGITGAEG